MWFYRNKIKLFLLHILVKKRNTLNKRILNWLIVKLMAYSIEKKLDLILRYYKRNQSYNQNEWNELYQFIGEIDFKEANNKVEKDGFVIKRENISNPQLTIEGKLFLRRGGYVGDKLRANSNLAFKIISSFVLIVGTCAATFFGCSQYESQCTDRDLKLKEQVQLQTMQKEILKIKQKIYEKDSQPKIAITTELQKR